MYDLRQAVGPAYAQVTDVPAVLGDLVLASPGCSIRVPWAEKARSNSRMRMWAGRVRIRGLELQPHDPIPAPG